jgi:hypothetical protein
VIRIDESEVEGTELESLATEVERVLKGADIQSVGQDTVRVVLLALRRLGRV